MADDPLAAMLAALNQAEKGQHAGKARTPDQNNPWRAEPTRASRRTRPGHRDPTGEKAIGNIRKKEKK